MGAQARAAGVSGLSGRGGSGEKRTGQGWSCQEALLEIGGWMSGRLQARCAGGWMCGRLEAGCVEAGGWMCGKLKVGGWRLDVWEGGEAG